MVFTARLGGAWSDSPVTQDAYPRIGYVFVTLPGGEQMQLFYNAETRLFVADVIHGDHGNEFVRITAPTVPRTLTRRQQDLFDTLIEVEDGDE